MATTPPTAQRLHARCLLMHGDTQGKERSLLDYTEATTTTGNQAVVIAKELAGGAVDQSQTLPVDTCNFIAIRDRGGTGFKYSLASGGTKTTVAANGFIAWKHSGTVPTLHLDNLHASDVAFLEIIVMGSSS